jgi:phosphoserine phosphatase RsbU/P
MGRLMVSRAVVYLKKESEHCYLALQKGTKLHKEHCINPEKLLKEPYLLNEFPNDQFHKELIEQKLELVIPLSAGDQIIGLFVLGSKLTKDSYDKNELNYLTAMSNIAGKSIENAINFASLQQANLKLDKNVQQLQTLIEIGRILNESLDFDILIKSISRTLMGHLMLSKHGIIYNKKGTLELILDKGLNINHSLFNEIVTITKQTLKTEFNNNSKLIESQIELIVPIVINFEIKGFLVCGRKAVNSDYENDELQFLSGLANSAATALDNAVLFKETLEKQKLEEELELARTIQTGLLPKKQPNIEHFQIHGSNQPSKQVGGDYFDYIKIDEKILGIVIADVSGKGAAAALLMSNVQASMQALTMNRAISITEMIGQVNRIIHKNTSPEKYITFFYGELNKENKAFHFVNAGHNYPLVYRNNEFIALKKGGIIIGMMDGVEYESETIILEKNDVLVMYTDGITEAMDSEENEFDEPRLKKVISENVDGTAKEIHNAIIKAVFEFSPNANDFDDITLIVLKVL